MADCSSAILLSVQGKKNKFKSYWSWSGSNFFWQDCWRSICLKFEKRITIRAIQQLCETLPKLKFVRNQLIFLMFLLNKPITRQRLVYQIMTDLRMDGGTDLLTGVGARDVTASKNRLLFKKDFEVVGQGVTWYVARQVCKGRPEAWLGIGQFPTPANHPLSPWEPKTGGIWSGNLMRKSFIGASVHRILPDNCVVGCFASSGFRWELCGHLAAFGVAASQCVAPTLIRLFSPDCSEIAPKVREDMHHCAGFLLVSLNSFQALFSPLTIPARE